MSLEWQLLSFSELTSSQLYQVLALRSEVFVVEQTCPYQDIDGLDQKAWHLLGLQTNQLQKSAGAIESPKDSESIDNINNGLIAYMRIFAPGQHYQQSSMGRIITKQSARGQNVGRALVEKGLQSIEQLFATKACKIQAQSYLKQFYQSFGFEQISEEYLEDDIPHIDMLRQS
jgi:ElaA protein